MNDPLVQYKRVWHGGNFATEQNSRKFSDVIISRYMVQLYRVNNNYYVKNTVELKNFTYLIKNNVHFYYAIFVIFSSFPEDTIPIGRGRA